MYSVTHVAGCIPLNGKSGRLPHAHISVWLIDKILPEVIGSIVSAEIPVPSTDQMLFDIVIPNMIHGPCCNLNCLSLCIADRKYTKSFLKNFTYNMIQWRS